MGVRFPSLTRTWMASCSAASSFRDKARSTDRCAPRHKILSSKGMFPNHYRLNSNGCLTLNCPDHQSLSVKSQICCRTSVCLSCRCWLWAWPETLIGHLLVRIADPCKKLTYSFCRRKKWRWEPSTRWKFVPAAAEKERCKTTLPIKNPYPPWKRYVKADIQKRSKIEVAKCLSQWFYRVGIRDVVQ